MCVVRHSTDCVIILTRLSRPAPQFIPARYFNNRYLPPHISCRETSINNMKTHSPKSTTISPFLSNVVEFDFHHSHTDWCIERKGTGASRIVLVVYTSQVKCSVEVDPALRVHAYSSCSGTRRVAHAQAHLAMPLQRHCMWRTQKRSCRDERPNFCNDGRQNTQNPIILCQG